MWRPPSSSSLFGSALILGGQRRGRRCCLYPLPPLCCLVTRHSQLLGLTLLPRPDTHLWSLNRIPRRAPGFEKTVCAELAPQVAVSPWRTAWAWATRCGSSRSARASPPAATPAGGPSTPSATTSSPPPSTTTARRSSRWARTGRRWPWRCRTSTGTSTITGILVGSFSLV